MSLIGVQRRFRELGRIRLGEKGITKGGKSYPKKLAGFRLTSPSHALLLVAADLYGGEVRKWDGAPGLGDQWELYVGDRIDVLLPPGEPLTQSFELWSGGGCVRRCDGATMGDGSACQCPADMGERMTAAALGQACKPTTRLSVILPRLPDIGVWRMESHGYNAAVELPGTVDLLRTLSAGGGLVPAFLRVEQRTSVKDGETRHFVVPVLELPTVTVAELMGGGAPQPSLAAAPAPVLAPAPPAAIAPPRPAPAPATAMRPTEPPPLPGDTAPLAPLADPELISGLIERLKALTKVDRWAFVEKYGKPQELPAVLAIDAEALVTRLEDEAAKDATPAPDDPGRPFDGPTVVSVAEAQHLHITAKGLGFTEDDIDVLILHRTGGESSSAKALSPPQMKALLDALTALAASPTRDAQMAEIRNRVLEAAGQQAMT